MPSLVDKPIDLPPIVFRAHANAGTVVAAANTPTKINLQIEDIDTNNCFSGSRFQPTVAGYYHINAAVTAGAATSYIIAQIAKNGAVYSNGVFAFFAANSAGLTSVISDVIYLNGSTDYVELFAQLGSAQTTDAAAATNYMSGHIIR